MTEIRSFRSVFELERRIYSIDSLRLNPGGIPVRAVVYFACAALAAAGATALPVLGLLPALLPWYVRELALPVAMAALMTAARVDGRPIHLAASSLVRLAAGPARTVGLGRRSTIGERWRPEPIVVIPDGSDAELRRLRYMGPGSVLVGVEHELRETVRPSLGPFRLARADLTLQARPGAAASSGAGKVVVLERGASLLVRRSRVG